MSIDEQRPKQVRLPAAVRRERIVETALGLFAEHGYNASMGDVAAATGVARPVLYYYFPAKKDLFVAVVESQLTMLLRYLAPAVASEGSDRKRFRATLDAMLSFAEEQPQSWQVLFRHLDDQHEPEVQEIRAEIHDAAIGLGAQLLATDASRIGVDPESVRGRLLAESLHGAYLNVVRWWHEHPSVAREEVLDTLDGLVWQGIGGLLRAAERRAKAQAN